MSDGKFFSNNTKQEVLDLVAELHSSDKVKVKDAVKKVIAAMTIGKDVSQLFTDVVKSIQTTSVELKKLVYLYVINYARQEPEKALLVINTFQRDAAAEDPLIRALALRTMGCIRVDRITEYLCEPLGKCLKDKDPYVRKTAALCVAKLYEINPDLVEEQGFLELLRALVADPNPMVMGNAVAALGEISELGGVDVLQIDSKVLSKLLVALTECTEWGQVFILDCLAKYDPSPAEAENIVERVSVFLKHSNAAVSMSSIRVVFKALKFIQKNEELTQKLLVEKVAPSLITLIGEHKPEVQYVALRNINLICQSNTFLESSMKHFFCKYNDPVYVKLEKLQVMVLLCNMKNIDKALAEFKEYAGEVDIKIVRKSVSAIGQCAIKLEQAAARCIAVLLELIKTKVSYVMQEAIVVIRDIFRKYPGRYESIIGTLCENLDSLDEPAAKASMIWIVGEYAERIDNSAELLESFVEGFREESAEVQLQLLSAVVKLFLKKPESAKAMITTVLNMATDNADNPDLRDRGYIYWRLLSSDPAQAQAVILAKKPDLSEGSYQLDKTVLDVLMNNLSTLASVYHKPPELFVYGAKPTLTLKATEVAKKKKRGDDSESDDSSSEEKSGESESDSDSDTGTATTVPAPEIDLLGIMSEGRPSAAATAAPIILSLAAGKGVQVRSSFLRQKGILHMAMTFENGSNPPQTINQIALKFNKNFAGLAPGAPIRVSALAPGSSANFLLPLSTSEQPDASSKPGVLQCALKTDLGHLSFFLLNVPFYFLFEESGRMAEAEFPRIWTTLPESKSLEVQNQERGSYSMAPWVYIATCRVHHTVEAIRARMEVNRVFLIANRTPEVTGRGDVIYLSLKYLGVFMLLEIVYTDPRVGSLCTLKSERMEHAAIALQGIHALLTSFN